MTTDPVDDSDDVDLPAVEADAVSTGAAADSADPYEHLKGLPRLLRFAMMISHNARPIKHRLIAEINELCPNLPLNAAWAEASDVGSGLALAKELDRRAVTQNEPNLRSLADCVRLLCLPVPRDATYFSEHRRVGKALVRAFYANLPSRRGTAPLRSRAIHLRLGGTASLHRRASRRIISAARNATSPRREHGDVPRRCRRSSGPTTGRRGRGEAQEGAGGRKGRRSLPAGPLSCDGRDSGSPSRGGAPEQLMR